MSQQRQVSRGGQDKEPLAGRHLGSWLRLASEKHVLEVGSRFCGGRMSWCDYRSSGAHTFPVLEGLGCWAKHQGKSQTLYTKHFTSHLITWWSRSGIWATMIQNERLFSLIDKKCLRLCPLCSSLCGEYH